MGDFEYKTMIIGIIFFLFLNISLGFVIGNEPVEHFDKQEVLDEVTSELGVIGGFISTALLEIGLVFFGLFGVNFISAIAILPLWMNLILVTYNIIIVLAVIFWLVSRLWIG